MENPVEAAIREADEASKAARAACIDALKSKLDVCRQRRDEALGNAAAIAYWDKEIQDLEETIEQMESKG